MATPPRSGAVRSLRPPRRRPIGVRAPATITDVESDMAGPPLADWRLDVTKNSPRMLGPTLLRWLVLCNHAQHDLRHVRSLHGDRPRRCRRARPGRSDRVLRGHLRDA